MANTETKSFGEWLVARMEERDLRQYQFAQMVGTSPTAVSAWVNGAKRPTRRSCWAIADALGISRDEVLIAAGHQFPGRPLVFVRRSDEEYTDEEFEHVLMLALRDHDRLSPEIKRGIQVQLMQFLYNAPGMEPSDATLPDGPADTSDTDE